MSNTTTTITTNQPTVDVWVEEQIKTFPKSSTLGEILTELKLGSKRVIFIHGGKSSTKQELRSLLLYRDSLKVADAYDKHDLIDLVQKYPSIDHKGKKTHSESPDQNQLSDFRVEFDEFRKYFMESQKRHDELMGLIVSQLKPPQHFNMAAEDEEEEKEEEEEEEEEGDNGAGEPASEEEGDNGAGEPASEEEDSNIQVTLIFDGKTKYLNIPPGLEFDTFVKKAKQTFKVGGDHSVYFVKGGRRMNRVVRGDFTCEMNLAMVGGGKRARREASSSRSQIIPVYAENPDDPMEGPATITEAMKMRNIDIQAWLKSMTTSKLETLLVDLKKYQQSKSMGSTTCINRLVSDVREYQALEELEAAVTTAKQHLKIVMNTSFKQYDSPIIDTVQELIATKKATEINSRMEREMQQMMETMKQRENELQNLQILLQQQKGR